ncbi:MAG: hypothetical protein HYY34_00020, partial [Chloroflexi bacterium]|nr:hypothetical protein [Chloroflexota bacterium]
MSELSSASEPTILVATPTAPPEWALLERELIRAQADAIRVFHEKYFDERGYLLCVPRWGGNDGPDDAGENMLNWTMLYALGAPQEVLDLFKHAWEGHLRQYTEAKTVEVPLARDGMYYKEFPVMFDWFHHGEWLSPYALLGLADPGDPRFEHRTRKYAGFYMGEEPQAPNYDPSHRIIRSMFNGSRGPLMRKATGLDWAGDPIEMGGRFTPGHGERTYEEMIAHFKDYNDVVGDNPLNLGATTLALNAYALTGEKKYRDWCLEYVGAWAERTKANGGLIPTNIGLDGSIGGEAGGKWYGGVYGWGFSVIVPQTGEIAHRSSFYTRCHYGFGNALLMTGDQQYVDVWRGVIEKVNSNAREIDGKTQWPRSYGDNGWYNFQPTPFDEGAMEVYFWSMRPEDRKLVAGDEWVRFLNAGSAHSKDVDYPVRVLKHDLGEVRTRVEGVRNDNTSPDTRMSDDMNSLNPAVTESLTRLMLGGLPTGRVGYPLHCRLRYFDPARRRPGVPEDVAALVDRMTGD